MAWWSRLGLSVTTVPSHLISQTSKPHTELQTQGEHSTMKKYIIACLLAALSLFTALPSFAQVPSISYQAMSGVSLFTGVAATATSVSAPIRLPEFTGAGSLEVTEAGITGSPSGCSIALAFQSNNAATPSAAVATISFTPATGVQLLAVNPTGVGTGDNYVATYACSTYPTAGTITVSFSPAKAVVAANFGDPCKNPNVATSSAVINVSSATTTQLVALAAGKSIYVCQATASGGSAATALFEYGTGSSCGTGTTALTGAMALSASQPVSLGWGGLLVAAPVGNALCLVTGGTVTTAQGLISYVQQ
jgi:hypothetical protein